MKHILVVILIFLLGLSIYPDNKQQKIESLFKYLEENNLFNGNVLVEEKGNIIFQKSFGIANAEWNIPNTDKSKFEIGSVTKQFTAMVILQLNEEGKLSLNAKLSEFFGGLTSKNWDKITIHNLLTHTSGIPSHSSIMGDMLKIHSRVPYTFNERFNQIKNKPLKFIPGTSWEYDGFGYTILGEIAKIITGKSLEYNFKKRIFEPLRMKDSGVFLDNKVITHRSYGYQKDWDETLIIPVQFSQTTAKVGGGGIYSTTPDMYKWNKALQDNKYFSKDILQKLFKVHFSIDKDDGYCYGFFYKKYILKDKQTVNVYYHGGSTPGTSSLYLKVPSRKSSVILFNNTGMAMEGFLEEVSNEILNILNKKPFTYPKQQLIPLFYSAVFGDMEIFKKQYLFLKKNRKDVYIFNPLQLSTLVKIVMSIDNTVNLSPILNLNIQEYPQHYIGYYDMGLYYKSILKDKKKALKYFEEAVKRSDKTVKEMIKKEINNLEN